MQVQVSAISAAVIVSTGCGLIAPSTIEGGHELLLQIDTEDALHQHSRRTMTRVEDLLEGAGAVGVHCEPDPGRMHCRSTDPLDETELSAALAESLADWTAAWDVRELRLELTSARRLEVIEAATDSIVDTVSDRLEAWGVGQYEVEAVDDPAAPRISVRIPARDDLDRLVKVITTGGALELRPVYLPRNAQEPVESTDRDMLLGEFGGRPPPGTEALSWSSEDKAGYWTLVETAAPITGDDLLDARPSRGSRGEFVVSFTLREDAAERFSRFTRENMNRRLAIVLDDRVVSAPMIQAEIRARGQIDGNFSEQEAHDLSLVLQGGGLACTVSVIDLRASGSSKR